MAEWSLLHSIHLELLLHLCHLSLQIARDFHRLILLPHILHLFLLRLLQLFFQFFDWFLPHNPLFLQLVIFLSNWVKCSFSLLSCNIWDHFVLTSLWWFPVDQRNITIPVSIRIYFTPLEMLFRRARTLGGFWLESELLLFIEKLLALRGLSNGEVINNIKTEGR